MKRSAPPDVSFKAVAEPRYLSWAFALAGVSTCIADVLLLGKT